jgi:hypothetical protein
MNNNKNNTNKEPLEIIATETNDVLSDDFESKMDPHFCSDYISAHQKRKSKEEYRKAARERAKLLKLSEKQPAQREPNQVPQENNNQ